MSIEINYTLSNPKPHKRFLEIEARFPTGGKNELELQLPAWRPGRYELGNFSRNIQRWEVYDAVTNAQLGSWKTGKETWVVSCPNVKDIVVKYNYYAAELNAGSTWVDDNQMYVNPVNCFIYLKDQPDSIFNIQLSLPEDYEVATGMEVNGHQLRASGVQQLMDCPFMAASDMWHRTYAVEGCTFHIWIKGKHRFDEGKLLNEFKAFTIAQLKAFVDIPCKDYHFLFQFPDHDTRHGVEHENSTVIALGPAERLLTKEGYDEMLGISCHELYHTWNIKSIRPKEMMPYDFTQENFSRLGYVAEGVTTYYGDLYLLRSGVWSEQNYLSVLAGKLKQHLHNVGRFNLSVADSSFDTWVDGYSRGIPHRKVSIYTEGCLTAFLTDVSILKSTGNKKSLDDAMRIMYERFGKEKEGYTEEDYRNVVNEVAEESLSLLFEHYIYGKEDYLPALKNAFEYLGVELKLEYSNALTSFTGMQYIRSNNRMKVWDIWPNSPADQMGLTRGDEIIAVNGTPADNHFEKTILLQKQQLNVSWIRDRRIHQGTLTTSEAQFYPEVKLIPSKEASDAYLAWTWKKR